MTDLVIQALAWSLLHLLWEGAAIALILAVALSVVRSAGVRYAVSCSALFVLLASLVCTFAFLTSRGQTAASPAHLPLRLSAEFPGSASNTPQLPAGNSAAFWVVMVWLTGVFACSMRAAGGWLAAHRWRTCGVSAAEPFWQAKLNELRLRLRLHRHVRLLRSNLAEVPVAVGWLRPVILFPAALFVGVPAEQLEYILLHELAHIKRHDYLVNLLQTMAESLLFYHPAAWWISQTIRTERENCCDDIAAELGSPHAYAKSLAMLEEYRQARREPAMAATGGNLMKRIQRLLACAEQPRSSVTPIFSALLVLVSTGILVAHQARPVELSRPQPPTPKVLLPAGHDQPLPMLAQARAGTPAPSAPSASASSQAEPWRRWLNEDVVYIITDEERAAYNRLTTSEEREMFIQQFWQRRDPTPGTAANEYKDEHYRRIAFANQHFSAPAIAGWKTDRGRIYIVYGPPDEIDSHPSGGSYTRPTEEGGGTVTVAPFEQWLYRYIQGIGNNVKIEFVEATPGGAYRMTMDPHAKEKAPEK